MKLGNTSQSKVPIPKFFLNNSLKNMETFEVSQGKRYFREKDLFGRTKDINFCNNQRNYNRKNENFNKQKYIPDLTNINSILKSYSQTHYKKSPVQKNIPKKQTYENFKNFIETTNITNFTNPGLRDEIKSNINVLINRIKFEYDINKWCSTDTRNNFSNTNSENFNLKTVGENRFNETDNMKFKTILKEKLNSMSIDKNLKSKLTKNTEKFNNFTADKFYDTITKNKEHMIDINDNFDIMKITLPNVTNKYSTVSNLQVQKLRNDNKNIYEKYNNTTLFRDFPSPDRSEFTIKKGEKLRTKKKKKDESIIDITKYNASKHISVFCEYYNTNDGFMLKYRKSKDAFY